MPDIWTLLTARRRAAAALPLVTYLDAAHHSRTELSAASIENVAAKIANALRDEFALEAGSSVGLALPLHWQRSAWCAGVWTAGCVAVAGTGVAAADLVVAGPVEAAALAGTTAGEIMVVSLHTFGLPITEPLPAGASDVTLVVRQQPDAYLYDRPDGTLAAFSLDGSSPMTQDDVLDVARHRAGEWGLEAGGRLLVDDRIGGLEAWLACLAVPLAVNASALLVSGDYDANAIAMQERATAFTGPRQ